MMRVLAILLSASILLPAADPASTAARNWREAHERAILREFVELLAIPNLATDLPNIRRNATAIRTLLEKRGVATRLLEIPDAPPVVFGEIKTPGAQRTVVIYAHYDGQPLNPKEWAGDPWKPVFRDRTPDQDGRIVELPADGPVNPEWRIYARSASDDKAPVIAITSALDALHAARIPLKSNFKFIFEGEEEASSPHLGAILAKYQDLIASDLWLICDGPVHQSRRQQIVFGARGVATVDLTIYGPKRELHSGHYGNWAPNPAMMLARLLASMKDDDGKIVIPGFYDGVEPLGPTERKALADAPDTDRDLMRELYLGRTENSPRKLVELITIPSLNVRGMAAARTGSQASNVIPAMATATIDMRLVKGISHDEAVRRLTEHIRKQGYFIVDHEPDAATRMDHPKLVWVRVEPGGYDAARTSMDLPLAKLVVAAAERARGEVVKLPTSGGSVPLVVIEKAGRAPTISTPIANHDNSQHSFNENIRIQNLWDGIELMAALLAM